MKQCIILFSILIIACVPSFNKELCLQQCSQCPGIPCDYVCDRLNDGHKSITCKSVSENVWSCALVEECAFVEECQEEIDAFLSCIEE